MKTEIQPIKITLSEKMLGTVPKNKEVYKQWILDNLREQLENKQITKEEFESKEEEELETIKETEEKGWTGFHADEKGLFIFDYMIRGFLKSAGIALKDQCNMKAISSKIDRFVFVRPRTIYLIYHEKNIVIPHGIIERPLRAQTMQGPRITLVRSDYVNKETVLNFEVEIIENSVGVDMKFVKCLLEYGRFCGLGQFRNGSYGRFEFSNGAKVE